MPDKLIIISILLHRLNLCFLAHLIYVVRSTLLLNCLKEHINNFSRSTHSNKGWQDRWHYQITSFILRSLQPCVRKLRASEYRLQFWPITKGKRPWAAHVPALEKVKHHLNKLIIFFFLQCPIQEIIPQLLNGAAPLVVNTHYSFTISVKIKNGSQELCRFVTDSILISISTRLK